MDLQTQILFPAIFAWGQYEDFKSQIKDKYQRIMVQLKDKLYTKLYHYILFLFCAEAPVESDKRSGAPVETANCASQRQWAQKKPVERNTDSDTMCA